MGRSNRANPQTVELLLSVAQGGPERQQAEIEASDEKLVSVLQAAGLIGGVAGLSNLSDEDHLVAAALSALALAVFAALAILVVLGLRTRQWDPWFDPDEIWREQWDLGPEDVRHSLIERAGRAYAKNRDQLNAKNKYLRYSIWLLVPEVLLTALSFVSTKLI